MQKMLATIEQRFNQLGDAREQYRQLLNNPILQAAKFCTAVLTGALFFSGGFFAGQSMALAAAAMIAVPVTATMAPVLIASVLAGIGSFSIYWNLERIGLENLVGRWVGLDKDKVDYFADPDLVAEQKEKINLVKLSLS
jgi:hypothetical protein